ncbi:SRPBCC domain-containing protein [Nonomuraea rubra]
MPGKTAVVACRREARADPFLTSVERLPLGASGAGVVAKSEYHDIVPDERIVYATALFTGEVLSTVSLTTVRFVRDGDGTRLVLTEQGTFLDGQEQPEWREQGTGDWLDALGRQVARR